MDKPWSNLRKGLWSAGKLASRSELSIGPLKAADVDKGMSEPVVDRVGGSDRSGFHQHFAIDLLGQQVPHEVIFFMLRGTKYKVRRSR